MSSLPTPEELKELRKKAGLTQKELARRAGVSQSLIARIESGSVDPRLSTLRRILQAIEDYVSEQLTVKDVMASPVIIVKINTPIEEVIELMWEHGISQIPVVNKEGVVVGTVYERTLVDTLFKYKEKALDKIAGDVMTSPLPMVSPDENLHTVAQILRSGYSAVLVMSGREILGIVTNSDLMKCYLILFKKREHKPA